MNTNLILFLCCILPLIIMWVTTIQVGQTLHTRHIKNKKETNHMCELAKQFIGQDCIVYFLGGSSISGVIKEVAESGNAITVVNDNNDLDLINLEFVTRIRKYPLNKNGKRKSIIW